MNMRDASLNYARQKWADYLLSLDADVFLTNPDTLKYLVSKNLTVVAPMLLSEGLYSNFWHGMTDDYYYLRTEAYKPILNRENTSCYAVPMVHSCVLINLRRTESDYLTYRSDKIKNYNGPHDDIIVFALSAMVNHVPLHICNEEQFGYITVPLEQEDDITYDYEHLLNIKMEVLNSGEPLFVTDKLRKYTKLPKKDRMMFDKIFMINLKRRPDRRNRMYQCFDELGLDVETLDAVDGQLLNESFLETMKFMPDFKDPYHKRPMKLGEIGCFLSHYQIWKEVDCQRPVYWTQGFLMRAHVQLTGRPSNVKYTCSFKRWNLALHDHILKPKDWSYEKQIAKNGYELTLVLEDDIRFESFFRSRVKIVMSEASRIPNWDLVYFGRKRLQEKEEAWIAGAHYLVEAGYSYWTLGYALSLKGAKKLLDADPLTKLVPVDEYLPILFDKHPHEGWKGYYPKRDLVALSAAPLLLYPTHYTGEKGYISDTEDSVVVPDAVIVKEDL